MDKTNEPKHRRGNKSRLRLSTVRKKKYWLSVGGRKRFDSKHNNQGINVASKSTSINLDTVASTSFQSTSSPLQSLHPTSCLSSPSFCESMASGGDYDNTCTTYSHLSTPVDLTSTIHEVELQGRYFVSLQSFIEDFKRIIDHATEFGCTAKNMVITGEQKIGLQTKITFTCNMCLIKQNILTDHGSPDINTASVVGIMNVGLGYTHLSQLMAAAEVKCMSRSLYAQRHESVCNAWEQEAIETMQSSAAEERRLAIEAGDVDNEGNGLITVIVDGAWAKRSYRTNFNSLSGAAFIIGARTKKVIFLGIRNKFCSICHYDQKNNSPIRQHLCYKNWEGSSPAMEKDILAEGFSNSVAMYKLVYRAMIADGDSSCYKRLLDLNPYKSITIRKIECRNHLIRNYIRKMMDLSSNVKSGPLVLRQKIKKSEKALRRAVWCAIAYRKKEDRPVEEKVSALRKDLINGPSHIFGEHKLCKSIGYFCQKEHKMDSVFQDMTLTDLYDKIICITRDLAKHADSLIEDVDTNSVEHLNATVAKYLAGKRIFYSHRRSYNARVHAAVLSQNTGKPLSQTLSFFNKDENASLCSRKLEENSLHRKMLRKRKNTTRPKKRAFRDNDGKDYGDDCEKPDMPPSIYEKEKESFLKSIVVTNSEIEAIEKETKGQFESIKWKNYRRNRITASKIHKIIKRRQCTSSIPLVKEILYPDEFDNHILAYGRQFEKVAIAKLSSDQKIIVEPSGLFISEENPFLAATPDGLVGETGIVEVKCPYSARNMTIQEAIRQRKVTFWTRDEVVNKKDKWFYQVQSQLNIADKEYCIFCCWTPLDMKIEIIYRDKELWIEMLNILKKFYFNCLLPEIVDPRRGRGDLREPDYIKSAIEEKYSKRLRTSNQNESPIKKRKKDLNEVNKKMAGNDD